MIQFPQAYILQDIETMSSLLHWHLLSTQKPRAASPASSPSAAAFWTMHQSTTVWIYCFPILYGSMGWVLFTVTKWPIPISLWLGYFTAPTFNPNGKKNQACTLTSHQLPYAWGNRSLSQQQLAHVALQSCSKLSKQMTEERRHSAQVTRAESDFQKLANTGEFIILQLSGTEPWDQAYVKNKQP